MAAASFGKMRSVVDSAGEKAEAPDSVHVVDYDRGKREHWGPVVERISSQRPVGIPVESVKQGR